MTRRPAHTPTGSPSVVARFGEWVCLGIAVLALAVYVITLAPGLTFEHSGTDGGDLIAAATTLGVPHPTGYPTYTLLASLASLLPLGETIAFRTNLFSALCAACAVGLACGSARMVLPAGGKSHILAAAAAASFAFSTLLWSQAVITEVYALLALFSALLVWLLLRWRKGGADSLLWVSAFVLGLGLGNHLTLVLAVPAASLLLWPERRRWLRARVLLPAAGCFLAGIAIYAYLPLAASHRPAVNWGDPRTWERFLWVVTAEQYQRFAFALESSKIPGRIGAWAALLGEQFGWFGLAVVLAGAWRLGRRDRRLAGFSAVWIALVGLYAFGYDTIDSHVYLLPVVLLMALFWGEGALYLASLAGRHGTRWRNAALAVLAALPFASMALHWQAMDLSDDLAAQIYYQDMLQEAEENALVIVRGDEATFSLWYAVYAEKDRDDVAVVSGPLLAYIWYREHIRHIYPDLEIYEPHAGSGEITWDDLVRELVLDNWEFRPTYVTDPKEEWESWFELVPLGDGTLFAVNPHAPDAP